MTILQQIVASKHSEVERAKRRLPHAVLATLLSDDTRQFAVALRQPGIRVIAEVKRASPSAGVLRPHDAPGTWQPERLAQAYAQGGAAALSVLTDVHFFWGHPDALAACREATALPALRKDFIIDVYQVDESRWLGADAILLIARVLDASTLQRCAARARELGMDVLIEVHEEAELSTALAVRGALIGVNNRDLAKFTVDLNRSARLRRLIPPDRLCVAESGLSQPEQLATLHQAGVNAFLLGEAVAAHHDPAAELARLRGA